MNPISLRFFSIIIFVFLVTVSCTIEGGFVYNYDVTVLNKLDEDIYVIDPDPSLFELILEDRTYKLEPDESIWLSWGESNAFSYVEIELTDRTCFAEVHEGFQEYIKIDNDWVDTYCPE